MGSITNISNGHYVIIGDHFCLHYKLGSSDFMMKHKDRSIFEIEDLPSIIDSLITFEEYLTRGEDTGENII